mgnify:CR=1 FL=1
MSLKLMLKNFFMTDIRYNGWGFPEDGTAARIKKLEANTCRGAVKNKLGASGAGVF